MDPANPNTPTSVSLCRAPAKNLGRQCMSMDSMSPPCQDRHWLKISFRWSTTTCNENTAALDPIHSRRAHFRQVNYAIEVFVDTHQRLIWRCCLAVNRFSNI